MKKTELFFGRSHFLGTWLDLSSLSLLDHSKSIASVSKHIEIGCIALDVALHARSSLTRHLPLVMLILLDNAVLFVSYFCRADLNAIKASLIR